tara:strand:+ start:208 stop:618 length:411 start_codon:yes stop_codon:yes gene_type:complete
MKHKFLKIIIFLILFIAALTYTYRNVYEPISVNQRGGEIQIIHITRSIIKSYIDISSDIKIIDPLNPNRKIGKSYIFPSDNGWEISGYYKKTDRDNWHPWLISLNSTNELVSIAVKDDSPRIKKKSIEDPFLSIVE